MSAEEDALKRRYREFLDLMPLTVAIAGLAANEGLRSFSVEQLEARAQVMVTSFKLARIAVREAIGAVKDGG